MTLSFSKKLFCPLVVFLILSVCPPMLSFSLDSITSETEGITALEGYEKDSTGPLLEELGISEDIYSVSCLSLIIALQSQGGYSISTFVSSLADKPPAT
jgi:hypothetical protein